MSNTKEVPKIQGNLDTNFLKLIAIVAMTVDHVGKSLFPDLVILQIIGRIAFPIFAYCIVVGCLYTHDFKKYLMRLSVFAVVSQPIYALYISDNLANYMRNLTSWNIFFTLIIGAVAVKSLEQKKWIGLITALLIVCLFNFDYGINGVAVMLIFYICRQKPLPAMVLSGILLGASILWGGSLPFFGRMIDIQCFAALALIPIFWKTHFNIVMNKYFFYCYYPMHLLAIWLLKVIMG